MPTPDPKYAIELVSDLRETYSAAEIRMMQKVARRLQRGITTPGWAEQKLAEISALNRELGISIEALNKYTAAELERLIRASHARGSESALRLLKTAKVGPISGVFTRVSPLAIDALYAQAFGQITSANLLILRTALDVYRSVVAQATPLGILGIDTRREVSSRMLNTWANSGITSFTDSLGRRWEMTSYAEMAARTSITRSYIEGRLGKFAQYTDLVRIDDSPEECPLCRKWEGKVVSQSGRDINYPSLSSAVSGGLFHPNCTHSVAPYFKDTGETLGARTPATSNPEGYEERQQQRYLEQNVRMWKRREAVAVEGSQDERYAQAKVSEWQAKTRTFVKETDRQRLYYRESIAAT